MADLLRNGQNGPDVTKPIELPELTAGQTKAEVQPDSGVGPKEKLIKSIICGLTICLGSMIMGATVAYASPALPNLNGNPNPFHLDNAQNSWIGSVVTLGALVGGLIGGPHMDWVGRKMALMTCAVPFAAAWIVLVSSPNFACLLAGRLLTGVGTGVYSVVCPSYVGEIAPASIRGLLGSCHQMAVCLGVLYVYVFGAFLSWTWLAVACSALNLLLVTALAFVPESPRWLLTAGRKEEAEFALRWLRGEDADLGPEMADLQEALKAASERTSAGEFLRPQLLKPLMISLGLMLFQQFSGINVIMIYTVQIFKMSKSDLDPNVQTVVVGVVGIVGTLVSVFVSDLAGRKVLLVTSGTIMALTMGGMGAFFYLLNIDQDYALGTLSWLPITCLVIFNFGFNVAFGPIPWLIMSELFPQRAKGVACGLSTACNWLFAFVMTKFFADVTGIIGQHGGYWVCAGFCALSVPFIVGCVPETKGKTLEEIQEGFK